MAQKPPRGAPERWAWTPPRRRALRLTLDGLPQGEVARRVGVHRHTLQNWSREPEWLIELRTRTEERAVASRFRRLHSTERLTDKLSHLAGEALDADRIDVARAGLILRELRDFQKLEREHLGMGRFHAGQTDQRSQVPLPSVLAALTPSHKGIGDQPFRDLIRDHLDDIGPEALAAATPQEMLILATQDVLTGNPEILDALHAEYAEEAHAEARNRVASERRR